MENESKYKLSPKEYNEQLSYIDVDQILLNDGSVKVNREHFDLNPDTKLDFQDKIKFDDEKLDGETVSLHQTYTLTCYKKRKREFGFKIVCTFEVIISQEKPLSVDFWEIFTQRNLRVNTWPYFREFVQNMTQRANVPPLTLPLFKS